MFIPKFYYDASTEDGAGGDNGGGEQGSAANQPDTSKEDFFGFSSKDELAAFVAKNRETEEERNKKQEIEKAEFIGYSVKNDFLKLDDVKAYETVSSRKDEELVFDSYVKEWKSENPDVTDEDEIAEQAKEAFKEEYRLDASGKAKERAIARLAKEAKELRNPFVSKYEEAKSQYQIDKDIATKMPEFEKFVDKAIEKIGQKVVLASVKDGEDVIPFDVELTEEDKKEISKSFKTNKTFFNYSKSASKEEKAKLEATLEKKINGFIKEKYHDQIVANAYEVGKGRAIAQGSTVGAFNSFGAQANGARQVPETKGTLTVEESNNRIAEDRRRYREQGR